MIDRDALRRLQELQDQIAEELDLDPDDPRVAEELASRIGEQLKRPEETPAGSTRYTPEYQSKYQRGDR